MKSGKGGSVEDCYYQKSTNNSNSNNNPTKTSDESSIGNTMSLGKKRFGILVHGEILSKANHI